MVPQIKIITLLLLFFCASEAKNIGETIDVAVSVAKNVIEASQIIWKMITEGGANKEVIDQLKYLSEKSNMLATEMTTMINEKINEITKNFPGLIEINRRLSKVHLNTLNIERSYENFIHYIREPDKYDSNIMKDFAFKVILDDSNGLDYLLEEIHGLMVKNSITSQSTTNLLIKHVEAFLRYTNIPKSPQQLFYDLFDYIIYTELKGRLTILYSYQILKKYQPGKYEGHIEKFEKHFVTRINETVSAFKKAVAIAGREISINDPVTHIEDVTYTELKHVFQEYIVNEYDISTSDKCYWRCYNYDAGGKLGDRCYYDSEICAHQRVCNGYIHNCRKQFDSTINICPTQYSTGNYDYYNRRYQYIEFNGKKYGPREEECSKDIVKTGHHYSHPFRYCDSCMCTCDDVDDQFSDRYFNLDPSMARTNDNYVITGARFVKDNNVIHIQIQEGHLLPNGQIDKNTVIWAPINQSPKKLHKLIWDESRGLNLNDFHVPKNHVLIGLSFHVKTFDSQYRRLHFKIFALPLNFTSGILYPYYHVQEITAEESSSNEIRLSNLDIPTRSTAPNTVKSKNHQYLKFTTSSLDYDAGQSTIPFIDIQKILTDPPMPISGAGIYHKSRAGSGGFIALRLFTYNLEPYLGANLLRFINFKLKYISTTIRPEMISNSIRDSEIAQHQLLINETNSIAYLSSTTVENSIYYLKITILVIILSMLLFFSFFIIYKFITRFYNCAYIKVPLNNKL